MKLNFKCTLAFVCLMTSLMVKLYAQSYTWVSSTEGEFWKQSTVKLQKRPDVTPALEVKGNEDLLVFHAWGATFNELGWDALKLLPGQKQETILKQFFAPNGDMHFSLGRFSMNANDYARNWYSCNEVNGDFQLKYFNIERDKMALILFIKAAKQYNPEMKFWVSPWSPPSWMKINNYYSVRSDKKFNTMEPLSDIALYEGQIEKDRNVFPQQLAVNDYFIQEPRYLDAYARYFCKFIDAYKEQGIAINKVMYQNEAYSYTIYPGCAWTPEGTIRFNMEYLAPALKKYHPDVDLYIGTINTNRFEIVDQILSDPRMSQNIKGVGFQWEGGQILPDIRAKYPQYKYVQTESECGWGAFDWKAAEHTFGLINYYLGNGCEEYTFWNIILSGEGTSGWGWKQNALIRVDPKSATVTYTPEYYAVKHYCNFVAPGSRLLAYQSKDNKMPLVVFLNPQGKYVLVAGNFNEKSRPLTVKLGGNYLNVTLAAHSLNTFQLN